MLIALVLPLIPLLLLLALAAMLADFVLRDGMLPHFALDDASAGEAWSQVWSRIKAEKKQFFVYALLRVALPVIAAVGLFFLLAIPGLILAGAVAAIEFGIHSTFADSAGASAVVGKLLEVFFGLLAFGFAVLAGICLGGPSARESASTRSSSTAAVTRNWETHSTHRLRRKLLPIDPVQDD